MARIRTIKPEMAKHEVLYQLERELDVPIRFAWAILPTQCDREGRFKWRPNALKTDILPYDDCDFGAVLEAWLKRGMLIKYRVGKDWFGWIPTFLSHQSINNREMDSVLPGPEKSDETLDYRNQQVDASATREVQAQGEGKGREGNRKGRKQTLPAAPVDERKSAVREAIKKGYCWANKTQDCPWGPAEEVALNAMFIDVPKSFTAEMLVDCVRNRFLSEDVRSDPPRKWIRMILTWKEAPLDRFGKPKLQGNGNGNGKPNKATERFNSNVEAIAQGFGLRHSNHDDTHDSELAELQRLSGNGERLEGRVATNERPIRVIDASGDRDAVHPGAKRISADSGNDS